jgi:translation initiation factor 1
MAKLKVKPTGGRVVYSSEHGRMCSACKKPVGSCTCGDKKKHAARPESDGVVRVRREKKGRGGKTATVVRGLPGTEAELKKIAKTLKQKCGVGGSVKDFEIVIQGDNVALVIEALSAAGHTVKQSGG